MGNKKAIVYAENSTDPVNLQHLQPFLTSYRNTNRQPDLLGPDHNWDLGEGGRIEGKERKEECNYIS